MLRKEVLIDDMLSLNQVDSPCILIIRRRGSWNRLIYLDKQSSVAFALTHHVESSLGSIFGVGSERRILLRQGNPPSVVKEDTDSTPLSSHREHEGRKKRVLG